MRRWLTSNSKKVQIALCKETPQALEKMLKALVCKNTGDLAPRIHNLNRLIDLTGVASSSVQTDILAEMNAFHIEGRYPETLTKPPTGEEAIRYMKRAEEVFRWLTNLL